MDEGQTGPRTGRPAGRLPRNRQRERVLQLVRGHDGAIDAVELAAQIGLHVTTVRFHLDGLCDEGRVARTKLRRPVAGRPRTGYVAVQERLDYRVLAEILAMELGRTAETRGQRAERAGRSWAARLASDGGSLDRADDAATGTTEDELDRAVSLTNDVFTRMGFSPDVDTATESTQRERLIKLHDCPVRELARSHPEVSCRIHLGLLQGLISKSAAERADGSEQVPSMSAELQPFVEPELCLARVVAE